MIRDLKALGLALAEVFVMGAVVASGASAQTNAKVTSDGPVTLTAKPTIGVVNAFTFFMGSASCPNATFTGHKFHVTPHEYLPSGDSLVTLTKHLGPCEVDGFPATVDMNGCDDVIQFTETTGGGDTYGVELRFICPAGKHIQFTVFTGASHAIRACTITITENEAGYAGAHATDLTNGKIVIGEPLGEIAAHRSGFGCTTATDNNCKWDIGITLEGRDAVSKPTAISLSH